MSHLIDFLITFGAFCAVIGPAVLVHEWGHFIIAKRRGIKVHSFSIGFPPHIFSKEWHGTEYKLGIIPLGGYIKMAGEDPGEEKTGADDEFTSKSIPERVSVIAAGPMMNIVFGLVICFGIYIYGVESSTYLPRIGRIGEGTAAERAGLREGDMILAIDGIPIDDWFEFEDMVRRRSGVETALTVRRGGNEFEVTAVPDERDYSDTRIDPVNRLGAEAEDLLRGNGILGVAGWTEPVIGFIEESSRSFAAGLREGDRILAIDGREVAQWYDIEAEVRASTGDTITFLALRGGETYTLEVMRDTDFTQAPDGRIIAFTTIKGIGPPTERNPVGPLRAALSSVLMTIRLARTVIGTVYRLITGEISPKLLAGPLGIAQGSGGAARRGLGELVYYIALITVNLGVVNLLPIPVLDGGWIFIFLMYEAIRGKSVPARGMEWMMRAGVALLLALVIFITWHDIKRMAGFEDVEEILTESSSTE